MNRVTLDICKIQLFINTSAAQISKKGRQTVIDKLTTLGMKNIDINGKGKNATYTFDFPNRFGELLMMTRERLPKYSLIELDCIDALIKGNERNGLVMFHDELIKEIAAKNDAEYRAVKSKFIRVKTHLLDCGLIKRSKKKSHRVKVDDNWITGNRALIIHDEIKKIWKDTYAQQLIQYQQLFPNAERVPKWVFKPENNQLAICDIPRWFGADCYKTAKGYEIDDRLLSDIHFANEAILQTFNLDAVRTEIAKRQEIYKNEKVTEDEIIADIEKRYHEEKPSIAERNELREQIKRLPTLD